MLRCFDILYYANNQVNSNAWLEKCWRRCLKTILSWWGWSVCSVESFLHHCFFTVHEHKMHHGFPRVVFFFPLILLHASITTKMYTTLNVRNLAVFIHEIILWKQGIWCSYPGGFCHEAAAPQLLSMGNCIWLYGATMLFLHWYALMLQGFHVRSLSEQHDTLHHPSGEFFWKFPFCMALLW